ncbi:hypothetical protein CHLNCDRAFT_145136 [Chlorella variabilis]|uniref:Uncharacterized protein n=1 Tax=Chlorella variabilis TaxID=554065 RepID=E1ZCN7_CHLVA|nr:hypothetical protein CHLNCDRAFT_145136 [Chlorella variabilis]EFN56273.1 hypothetical protein CHLNCDRAFT_145136 [Chlorella variabilis]|eukprot:XP_005848375.1 hypothetical protein CHLNCDRAFT_145136 [Chlorella variabilis]
MVGGFFNGGCYAKPYCNLRYNTGTMNVSIVGKYCASNPYVCAECCVDGDCPNVASGQKCEEGYCSSNGCTVFQCWQGTSKQVCKIDGTGCATGCGINECSDPQCCNSVEPDCSNLSNIRVQGRECAQSCTTTDPLYEPANFGVYSRKRYA